MHASRPLGSCQTVVFSSLFFVLPLCFLLLPSGPSVCPWLLPPIYLSCITRKARHALKPSRQTRKCPDQQLMNEKANMQSIFQSLRLCMARAKLEPIRSAAPPSGVAHMQRRRCDGLSSAPLEQGEESKGV
ncbi:hypothetical protein BKA81DRAFT_365585 [Phyllosticta paracitricarpa]